ncbi:precorrin-6A/cobalt-precorrin-6A reductase [Raineyella antarctica]|uniref:Precorrin-6A/cobalt-precorrin-6A reductase n=1 Tax=Raineyella antarctica TaxID=1577474 RepID=A0A1G6HN82_9ACTN|nr:precorrin-6A/cobalt-precorrin-6A reductase [Raineyella antarctica]SDB95603.1 precorrin-6A/cobalt-precorrin-6A reductase [Raineyella antarctica]
MTFLVLGGTTWSRELAVRLQLAGIPVVCGLLGSDDPHPLLPVEVIRGGFGGVEGLAGFLQSRGIRGVVDASHPFATEAANEASAASAAAAVPIVRLAPPTWLAQGGSARWRWAEDDEHAKAIVEALGVVRPFLSVGSEALAAYLDWRDRYVLARVARLPRWKVPSRWEVIRSGEPHAYAAEFALLSSRRIGVMVTRDTGGPLDAPKLRVAEDLGIFVVMIARPPMVAGLRVLQDVDDAYGWVSRHWRPQDR